MQGSPIMVGTLLALGHSFVSERISLNRWKMFLDDVHEQSRSQLFLKEKLCHHKTFYTERHTGRYDERWNSCAKAATSGTCELTGFAYVLRCIQVLCRGCTKVCWHHATEVNALLWGAVYRVTYVNAVLWGAVYRVTYVNAVVRVMCIQIFLFVFEVFNGTSAQKSHYCLESVKIKLVKKESIVVNGKL